MVSEREQTQSFAKVASNLLIAIGAGAGARQNEDFRLRGLELCRSERAFPNPSDGEIYRGILGLFPEKRIPDIHFYTVPWSNRVIGKGRFLITWVAVTDQHELPVDTQILAPQLARGFVERVVNTSDKLGRQITVLEQFKIAMELVDGRLLAALLIAHSGSRAIARGSESRAGLSYTLDDLKKWENCVSYFSQLEDGYGDPPGDTYHFWGEIIAGLLSSKIINTRDLVLNRIYSLLYPNTSFFVRHLRRGCFNTSDERFRHAYIDQMGFKIGQKLTKDLLPI